ncbi:MAG: DUF3787 domain-containing protein [Defluviitaleaceae bacterium]|nr:DUF3787 domain-containing protein [Defluviitaleaceae bacterium]
MKNKKKNPSPLLDTTPLADSSKGRAKDTNVAIPSDLSVEQAKEWVDENRL